MGRFPILKRRRGPAQSGRPDVVVITGASSGIGRAAAHEFAERGSTLVLGARSGSTLEDVVAECRQRGARALAVPTDVTEEGQVQALVNAAVETFGRIDVWVGAASVYGYGTFEQMPAEVFRRIIDTNLLGQVSGVRAVLPQFRSQGSGVFILIGSVYAKITSPYVAPYVTSKFGLLGFTEVLREELRDAKGISVCTVLPATIDTPIYQHAANYTGQRVHPLPPVVSPIRVARAIVRMAERPRPVAVVGQLQRTFIPFRALAPRVYEPCVRMVMKALALRSGKVPPSSGTVFEPQPETNQVTGGWRWFGRWR